MTGIVNSTGARSGIIGTTVGTPAGSTGSIAKWEQIITTPAATQGDSATYVTLTGSSKSYTPATGASYVVYEYSTNLLGDNTDNRLIQVLKFLYDGTMIDNGNWCFDTDGAGNQFGYGYVHFKFIIDVSDPLRTGSSTAWPADTAKSLNIAYRRGPTASYDAWWHRASHSGDGTDTNVFPEIYQSTYSVL